MFDNRDEQGSLKRTSSAPDGESEPRPNDAARLLLEGAIRMKESAQERTQARLLEVIEAEKRERANVEFWKKELNDVVAARQDLEESLRALEGSS